MCANVGCVKQTKGFSLSIYHRSIKLCGEKQSKKIAFEDIDIFTVHRDAVSQTLRMLGLLIPSTDRDNL